MEPITDEVNFGIPVTQTNGRQIPAQAEALVRSFHTSYLASVRNALRNHRAVNQRSGQHRPTLFGPARVQEAVSDEGVPKSWDPPTLPLHAPTPWLSCRSLHPKIKEHIHNRVEETTSCSPVVTEWCHTPPPQVASLVGFTLVERPVRQELHECVTWQSNARQGCV